MSSEADQCQSGYSRARASSNSRASNGEARPDNRLTLLDQAFFDGHRAAGQKEVMQAVWVYEHAIDFDGLRRLHHNLGYGLFGRLHRAFAAAVRPASVGLRSGAVGHRYR